MKNCIKCKEKKPLTKFYKHKMMLDGHLNKCKDCIKADASERYNKLMSNNPKFIESERKRGREKYHRYKYKSSSISNPSIKIIRAKTSHVVALHHNQELHHWSYNIYHAFDFICMTRSDHRRLHKHLVYIEEIKCFKTKDGELLDTKKKHLQFLKSLSIKLLPVKTKKR